MNKDAKGLIFIFVLILVFILFTFFKIHQSSIGTFSQFQRVNSGHSQLIWEPRSIRSDEWLVVSPITISQKRNSFNKSSFLIGIDQELAAMIGAPYYHWRVFFHPQYLPYFFLPLENAFAFSWWIGPLMMLIGIFLLMRELTNNNLIAIFTSLIFFFSPFNQWWSNSLSQFLGYGSIALYSFISIFKSKNLAVIVSKIFLMSYFFICFVFILYPPFQVSTGLFFLIFTVGYILNNIKHIKKNSNFNWIILSLVATVIFTAIFIFLYFTEFKTILGIIQNTVYPGKRIASGGNYDWARLLNGFYNIQLLTDSKGSGPWGNQSEASNFLLLYPFMSVFYIYILIKQIIEKKINWIFFGLILYLSLATAWLFVPLPTWVAHITLLYLVPPKRMLIGVGIADLFLSMYFLSSVRITKNTAHNIASVILSLLAIGINIYIGFILFHNYPVFIQSIIKIIIISIIPGLLVFFLLQKKQAFFLILLALYSIVSTYKVNPIYRGLDPLINTPLARKIQSIEKSNTDNSRWVVYDNLIWGQFVIANGGNSLSAIYLYPQFRLWRQLDPKGIFINVWNRYAHVFFIDKPIEIKKFILYQEDLFVVNINPCDSQLKMLKVKYYIMTQKSQLPCLKEISKFNTDAGLIYISERIEL